MIRVTVNYLIHFCPDDMWIQRYERKEQFVQKDAGFSFFQGKLMDGVVKIAALKIITVHGSFILRGRKDSGIFAFIEKPIFSMAEAVKFTAQLPYFLLKRFHTGKQMPDGIDSFNVDRQIVI